MQYINRSINISRTAVLVRLSHRWRHSHKKYYMTKYFMRTVKEFTTECNVVLWLSLSLCWSGPVDNPGSIGALGRGSGSLRLIRANDRHPRITDAYTEYFTALTVCKISFTFQIFYYILKYVPRWKIVYMIWNNHNFDNYIFDISCMMYLC